MAIASTKTKTTAARTISATICVAPAAAAPAPQTNHKHHQRHQRRHQQPSSDDCGGRHCLVGGGGPSRTSWLAVRWQVCVVAVAATLLLAVASLASAYPSGAPEQACKDLRPGHGAEPQTGAAPFELSQDKLSVGAGDQIKVTLSSPSGTNFKGLIVQADDEAGKPRGKFLPGTGLKALDSCSAVTHSDKEAKKTATLVWQAPDDLKAKEAFVFKATVVKKFDEIYTNIKSSLKSS